jgi:hypothetical protein
MRESRPGIWESVVLQEDGSLDVEWMTVFDDGSAMHSEAVYKPEDAKYEAVMSRHPNLQVGIPDEVEIPHTGKLEAAIDRTNEVEMKLE